MEPKNVSSYPHWVFNELKTDSCNTTKSIRVKIQKQISQVILEKINRFNCSLVIEKFLTFPETAVSRKKRNEAFYLLQKKSNIIGRALGLAYTTYMVNNPALDKNTVNCLSSPEFFEKLYKNKIYEEMLSSLEIPSTEGLEKEHFEQFKSGLRCIYITSIEMFLKNNFVTTPITKEKFITIFDQISEDELNDVYKDFTENNRSEEEITKLLEPAYQKFLSEKNSVQLLGAANIKKLEKKIDNELVKQFAIFDEKHKELNSRGFLSEGSGSEQKGVGLIVLMNQLLTNDKVIKQKYEPGEQLTCETIKQICEKESVSYELIARVIKSYDRQLFASLLKCEALDCIIRSLNKENALTQIDDIKKLFVEHNERSQEVGKEIVQAEEASLESLREKCAELDLQLYDELQNISKTTEKIERIKKEDEKLNVLESMSIYSDFNSQEYTPDMFLKYIYTFLQCQEAEKAEGLLNDYSKSLNCIMNSDLSKLAISKDEQLRQIASFGLVKAATSMPKLSEKVMHVYSKFFNNEVKKMWTF